MDGPLDRRRVLAGVATLLAGCGAGGGTDDGTATRDDEAATPSPTPPDAGTPSPTPPDTATPTPEPTATREPTATPEATDTSASPSSPTPTATPGGELDLREANVTGVAVSGSGGEYRFDVTLFHDDEGEEGFANWWQVETLDGERLGRRELLHAHGTREFTRSDTFELPDVDCVVVRGHDQTHGYGGRAMLVTVATGATRAVRQGPEPRSFAGADCP